MRDVAEMDNAAMVRDVLAVAMTNFALDAPKLDAAETLENCIAYFAEVYARNFGHAATVRTLHALARKGALASGEQLATE